MLGIVSMAGNALKAFGNTHPAVKWGVIVLALLLGVEFVAKEGRDVYVSLITTPYVVEKAKGDAEQAKSQGDALTSNIENDIREHETPQQRANRLYRACYAEEYRKEIREKGADFKVENVSELCAARYPTAKDE